MSLVAGVIARDALGRLRVVITDDTRVVNFNGGSPVTPAGLLVDGPNASGYNREAYLGGLGYTSQGALVTDAIGGITGHVAGLPVTAAGLATEFNGVPAGFVAGVPLSSTGRVCTAV
jgi:hypothetical protein